MHATATRFSPVTLRRHASAAIAFSEAIKAIRAHWQDNLPGARLGTDAEYLHQLRVALRRLWAVMRFCRPWVKKSWRRRTERLIRHLAKALGAARDHDVFWLATLPAARTALDGPSGSAAVWQNIMTQASARRDQALAQAQQTLCSAQCRRLGQRLKPQALRRALRKNATGRTIDRHARRALLDDYPALNSGFPALSDLTQAQRHALRIRIKRLRYVSELLRSYIKKSQRDGFFDTLIELQTALGDANDVAVALRFSAALPFDAEVRQQFEDWARERLNQAVSRADAARQTLRLPALKN